MPNASVATRSEPDWAAFVAIDWADRKHYWRLVEAGSSETQQGELDNTPEAVEVWAAGLAARFGGRPVAVAVEASRKLLWALSKYPHLVLFPVHPRLLACFRQAFFPSGSKDDPGDTALLLEVLLRHRERLSRWEPDTVETRRLQFLTEQRRGLVDDKTRQSNRLRDCLKGYFPQLVQWFDDVDSPLVGALLERWPELAELKRVHPGTLRKFFQEHNCRSKERIEERIQAIYAAVPLTKDAAVVEAGVLQAQALVEMLSVLRGRIAVLDQRIQEVMREHPERGWVASLPGAGAALEPRLIVALGTRRERYADADELLCYSGIAPVTERSGRSHWVHFRWACPKFLRQTFQEFAQHSLGQSEWARAYYDHLRAKGKEHHAAVRAVAYKWIRIIYRCWKDGKPYDEAVYVASLQKRRSPWLDALPPATKAKWNQVAGFQKFSVDFS